MTNAQTSTTPCYDLRWDVQDEFDGLPYPETPDRAVGTAQIFVSDGHLPGVTSTGEPCALAVALDRRERWAIAWTSDGVASQRAAIVPDADGTHWTLALMDRMQVGLTAADVTTQIHAALKGAVHAAAAQPGVQEEWNRANFWATVDGTALHDSYDGLHFVGISREEAEDRAYTLVARLYAERGLPVPDRKEREHVLECALWSDENYEPGDANH